MKTKTIIVNSHNAGIRRTTPLASALSLLLCACVSAPVETSGRLHDKEQRRIDRYVSDAISRYQLPGIALGIVRDGQVVYQRVEGETQLGSGAALNGDSRFKIASLSKAMTTAVLARLVERKVLRWDDPVRRYLPKFSMADPWVSEHMQVRDLLIHNSGLPAFAGDLLLWPEPNEFSRADILAALPHLQLTASFRSRYRYDNLLYVVAGEVAAKAAGQSFESLLQQEVFTPLGLSRCTVGGFPREQDSNIAQPHESQNGVITAVRTDGDNIAISSALAAGGIRCSLNDMLKWLSVWLQPEQVPGWLSVTSRKQLWQPQIAMPLSPRQQEWEHAHFHSYGYGWRLSDSDGQLKVSHTGTLAGMYSMLVLLPEQKTGFVILINAEADEARTVLSHLLSKVFTDSALNSSVEQMAQRLHALADPTSLTVAQAEPISGITRQTAVPGHYRDAWFGEVSICPENGQLIFQAKKSPRLRGTLSYTDRGERIHWLDESVGADVLWFPVTESSASTVWQLAPPDVEAGDDHDYQDLRFRWLGDCDDSR